MFPLPASKRLPISPHWLAPKTLVSTDTNTAPGFTPHYNSLLDCCHLCCVLALVYVDEHACLRPSVCLESFSLFPLLHGCCGWICLVRLIQQELLICRVICLALSHTLKKNKNKFEPGQFNIIDHFWFVIHLRKCLVIRSVFLLLLPKRCEDIQLFPTHFPHSVTCMLIFVISLMFYFC